MLTGPGYIYGDIYLLFGNPESGHYQLDVAYGTVKGQNRFLIVYADTNNCEPDWSNLTCPNIQDQHTGVWGIYVDPERLDYTDTSPQQKKATYPTPFPFSSIYDHAKTGGLMKPQVAYSNEAQAFAVVRREIPSSHPYNDVSHSYIRGAWVDKYIEDGDYGFSPDVLYGMPPENIVNSEITPDYCDAGTENYDP